MVSGYARCTREAKDAREIPHPKGMQNESSTGGGPVGRVWWSAWDYAVNGKPRSEGALTASRVVIRASVQKRKEG